MNAPTATVTTMHDCELLHRIYTRHTGLNRRYTAAEMRCWNDFLKAGLTAQDLLVTCRYLHQEVAAGRRHEPCMGFIRLIGDLRVFQDELNLARFFLQSS